jgi:putative transposase
VESLAVKQMLQHPTLAKAIADVGWGELLRQVDYKAAWYGRTLIKIDRWYPSSKTCSKCGLVLEHLDLDEREWTCSQCRAHHDRDINAARNILAEGLRQSAAGLAVAAWGGKVETKPAWNQGRHDLMNQELPLAMVGESLGLSRREDVNLEHCSQLLHSRFCQW